MYESLQSEMACEGRGEYEREGVQCAGEVCHWCDRPLKSGDAEFVGGHPMHPSCVDEHFGIDRDEEDAADRDYDDSLAYEDYDHYDY